MHFKKILSILLSCLVLLTVLSVWYAKPAHSSPDTLWLGSSGVADIPVPSATNGPQYRIKLGSPGGTVSTIGNELVAHVESIPINETGYYPLEKKIADTEGITLNASMESTGRTLLDSFVYSLQGISSIPASTWTMYYRGWQDATGIAYDAQSSMIQTTTATSISWSHTTGTGSNRLLLVAVGVHLSSGTPTTVSSVTYGGVSLTQVTTALYSTNPQVRTYIFRLVNPASGTNTIAVTFAAATLSVAGAVTYSGVDQTTPIQTNNTATGSSTSPSVSVTVTGSGRWIFGHLGGHRTSSWTINSEGSGQTNRWTQTGQLYKGRGSDKSVSAGSQSMSWSLSAAASYVASAVVINPVTLVGHIDVNILIRRSDGTIRTTIATNVANSASLTSTATTLSGTYSFAGYTVVDQTDYLEIDYYVDVTTALSGASAHLRIDDNTLALADQTRVNIPTPIYWYTPKYTGTISAGTYTLTIYYRASSASVKVGIEKTAPDGTIVSSIGSTTWTPSNSATITSTTVSISGSATSFTDQRFRLKINCTSGVLAVYFDGSSQPSKLDTPTFTPPITPPPIIVPDDYPTIQEAINAASNGDKIIVKAGTYPEQVTVNKSVSITGANPLTTIVDGGGSGTVFDIQEANIEITNFTIRNGGSGSGGVWSTGFNGHKIVNNIITTSDYGIYLSLSNNTKVFGNTISYCDVSGIFVNNCKQNNITSNKLVENNYGISIGYCQNLNVSSNTISGSAHCINIMESTDNYIFNNTLSRTSYGLYINSNSKRNTAKYNKVLSPGVTGIYVGHASDNTRIDHNYVFGGAYGIYLYQSVSCSIVYNVILNINSSTGIRLYYLSNNNNVSYNKVSCTDWGIELSQSNYNTIVGNWLEKNRWGVIMGLSTSETFYYNSFVNNRVQLAYTGTNTYDDGKKTICPICGQLRPLGNYWSDYRGLDNGTQSTGVHNCKGDGVGDTDVPHLQLDKYPFMKPWSTRDVSVVKALLSNTTAYVGQTVNITVVVKNEGVVYEGKAGKSETFNVTARYGVKIIDTQKVTNLAPGTNTTLIFYWDTTFVEAPFNHTISVEAVAVPDEFDTTDNLVVAGKVRVTRYPGPWWFIPGNYMVHTQPGSSRGITISIGWLTTPSNVTYAPAATSTVYPLWDRYNISFASPVGGKVHLFMPKESFSSRPFYLRPITLWGTELTMYTWGQLILPKDGNGTLAIQDGILDVDMNVTVTGKGNGQYSNVSRKIGDGVKDPAGSMMLDMPLNLTVYVGTSPTDPTWLSDLVTIPFPVWLTTGKINVTINDSKGPFPRGTESMNGYTASAQGRPINAYNGSTTVVATGGGLDLYYNILGMELYNDFMFKEVEVISLTVMTEANVSPNKVVEGEPIFISSAGVNQLFYPVNITVTVKACGKTGDIILNVTTFYNVNPIETITISVTWNTVPGNYTIKVEARETVKIDGTIVTNTDTWIAGTVLATVTGDINGDGKIDLEDFAAFTGAYGTSVGQPAYKASCDFNHDGNIDVTDFAIFSGKYGQHI